MTVDVKPGDGIDVGEGVGRVADDRAILVVEGFQPFVLEAVEALVCRWEGAESGCEGARKLAERMEEGIVG